MANPIVQLIIQGARARGLDPAAVLAVASREGLSGRIGDGGHAYGPFQLNNAGGVITNTHPGTYDQSIQQWASSPAGINFALDRIAGVARGQHGRQAISSIVQRFERPANIPGEIAGAVGAYGDYSRGLPQGPSLVGTPPVQPQVPVRPQLPDPGLFNAGNQMLGLPSLPPGLFTSAPSRQPMAGSAVVPSATTAPPPFTPRTPGKFLYPLATQGKIIGTPYHGTHTLYGNWESDNAVDISVPKGTPVYATSDGTIGNQIGSLGNTGDPRLLGLRAHLITKGNEFYYAHLSRLAVHAGEHVRKGQLIGYSGAANGVNHLHIASKSGNPLSYFGGHQ